MDTATIPSEPFRPQGVCYRYFRLSSKMECFILRLGLYLDMLTSDFFPRGIMLFGYLCIPRQEVAYTHALPIVPS